MSKSAQIILASVSIFLGNTVALSQTKPKTTLKFKSPVLAVVSHGENVFASSGNEIHVLTKQLKRLSTIKSELDFVNDVKVYKKVMIAAGGNPAEHGMVETYSWPGQKLLRRKIIHQDVIQQMATVDTTVVTASTDATIKSLELPSLASTATYSKHSKRVICVATLGGTSLDSKTIVVSGGMDDTLRVWELESGKTIRTLNHHQDDVLGIDPKAADDESLPMIVSVSRDKTIRFWQPTIGRMVRFKKLDEVPTVGKWILGSDSVLVGTDRGRLLVVDSVSLEIKRLADLGERIYSMEIVAENLALIGSSRGLHLIRL